MKKDFLSIDDIKRSEILELFELTKKLKDNPYNNILKNKIFCLYFEKPSTRTRMSFEVGIKQMGGKVTFMDKATSQLSRGETIGDTAKVLERYTDSIIARVYSHKDLELVSNLTKIPVVNALSDLEHPCQALADLFTIKEKFKNFKRLKLTFVGDGNNVCNSLLLACSKLGVNMTVACPKKYQPNKKIVKLARNYSKITKAKIKIMIDPKEAVRNSDVVYTDTFISMGNEKDKRKRLRTFKPKYRVTERLMRMAGRDSLFMHCLPAHRGEEVSSDVLDGYRSIVFDQAENRLHTQKALLIKLMNLEHWLKLE
jgi:ornithine carbamoyltransferase